MNSQARKRALILFAALFATLLAAYFAPPAEEAAEPVLRGAADRSQASSVPAAIPAHPSQARMQPRPRSLLPQEPGNLFQVDGPPPPPERSAGAIRPPAPEAPPLPYSYMGKLIEDGIHSVFLLREGHDKPYIVKTGDWLDGKYRVDAISPQLVEFTYLPLGQKQRLQTGETAQGRARPSNDAGRPPLPMELQDRLKQMPNSGASE